MPSIRYLLIAAVLSLAAGAVLTAIYESGSHPPAFPETTNPDLSKVLTMPTTEPWSGR
jgi:hypothetical protein